MTDLLTRLSGLSFWFYCLVCAVIILVASLVAGSALVSESPEWRRYGSRDKWQALLSRLLVGAGVILPVVVVLACTWGINALLNRLGWTSDNAYLAALAISLILVLGAILLYAVVNGNRVEAVKRKRNGPSR